MNKSMKKALCLALALVLVLALAGCGASEKDKLLGTWKGEMDLTELVNEALASGINESLDDGTGTNVADYFVIDEFKMTIVLTFNEDDTYSMSLDESSLNVTIEAMKDDIAEGMEQYLVELMAGMGVQMSIDEIMAAMDVTMEELVDSFVTEEMVASLVADSVSEGKFKAEDGKLYTSDGLGYEVDESVYESYTLDGSKLTIVSSSDYDDDMASVYPMVFEKVS